jgi:hypothetical protein
MIWSFGDLEAILPPKPQNIKMHQKMKISRNIYLISLNICFSATSLFSQPVTVPKIDFAPRSYVCYKATAPILVDGKLNDPGWLKAKWTEDFIDIEGAGKPAPYFATRVKMLWDDQYMYIAAGLEETDIWGTLTKRDTVIFYDNDFEIFIDPDGDTRDYYEIEMNALNTIWDLLLTGPYRDGDDGKAVTSWDIQGLKTAVNIQGTLNKPGDIDQSWTIEAAIPWKVLQECSINKTRPKPGDQWRFNFSRVEWKTENSNGRYIKSINLDTERRFPEQNWVWSPMGMINIHYPELWGFVQFSDKTVGSAEEQFVFNPDENVKWVLRKIYYAEKTFYIKNKRFTESFKEIGITPVKMDGYLLPVIKCTPDMFEATMTKDDKSCSWHIMQNSKTWRTP